MRPADVAAPPRAQRLPLAGELAGLLASFVRLSALGGTLPLPLVGAATSAAKPGPMTAIVVLTMGLGFHVFAYVLNDVVDLPIDRSDPRRRHGPLVRGLVTTTTALAVAGAAFAMGLLATLGAPLAALAFVAAGLGLGAYDLFGKRTRHPWLSDVVQGAGWAALVIAGAAVAGPPTALTFTVAAYVAAFIVQANGVHGAIRDLAVDSALDVPTTARLLGAGIGVDGDRVIPARVYRYAWALEGLLVALAAAAMAVGGAAVAAVPMACSVAILAAASRPGRDKDLLSAGLLHLVAGLLVPIALIAGVATPAWMAITIAAFSVPLLTHAWLPGSIAWATRATRRWIAVAAVSTARFVRLTRPHNDVAAGIAVVVGAHVGGRAELATEPVLRAAIVAALVVAAANVANDLADVAEDRVNRPTRPIAAGRVSTAAAARFAAALAILALGLAIPLGAAAVACVALLSAIAAAYSGYIPGVPALKGMGIIGNLVVAGLSGSTIVFGALVLADPAPAVAVATLAIGTSVLASEVLKATADREGDHAAGRRTLATTRSVATCLRVHRVLVVALVVLVLAAPLAGVVRPSFLVAAVVGVVIPQGLVAARTRRMVLAADVRRVLPLTKAAWFSGLAALWFLV